MPREKRIKAWESLVQLLPDSYYQQATNIIGLDEVIQAAEDITNGAVTGRTVIKL
ncbi:alcohol dehydrogenase [Vibrio ishigakensis]|uniref:Alcohol dehydrogenase n=1 Tax=Vibrio ishigakensis TaxID=1481914 RepID=A0A0B8QIV7_9VIBR|nr:alcohol dehydrogenase [Vibrio ishigakensis]GAM71122.1 alcohol dehydrogenase [Vibrio sp. JCM 19236]GAM78511.1 alcohol dehydrogenase [Vibrio ishigakensis]